LASFSLACAGEWSFNLLNCLLHCIVFQILWCYFLVCEWKWQVVLITKTIKENTKMKMASSLFSSGCRIWSPRCLLICFFGPNKIDIALALSFLLFIKYVVLLQITKDPLVSRTYIVQFWVEFGSFFSICFVTKGKDSTKYLENRDSP
jgi:hypothetical protein